MIPGVRESEPFFRAAPHSLDSISAEVNTFTLLSVATSMAVSLSLIPVGRCRSPARAQAGGDSTCQGLFWLLVDGILGLGLH